MQAGIVAPPCGSALGMGGTRGSAVQCGCRVFRRGSRKRLARPADARIMKKAGEEDARVAYAQKRSQLSTITGRSHDRLSSRGKPAALSRAGRSFGPASVGQERFSRRNRAAIKATPAGFTHAGPPKWGGQTTGADPRGRPAESWSQNFNRWNVHDRPRLARRTGV